MLIFIHWYYACNPYKFESISNIMRKRTEGKFSISIFSPLSYICYVSYRFTIEILEFLKVKEDSRRRKCSNIGYNTWKCRINICFVELTIKWKYLHSSICWWFLYIELRKHRKKGIRGKWFYPKSIAVLVFSCKFFLLFLTFLYHFSMNYSIFEPNANSLSFWQSGIWRNILISSWQAKEVFYYWKEDESWMLIEIREVWFWFYSAFSLGVSSAQFVWNPKQYFSELVSFLKEKGVLFLQIEPIDILPFKWEKYFTPYKYFLTPYTRVLNLTKTPDILLSEMHEKGRYNIRLAEKRGVVVKKVSFSEENIFLWINMLSETTKRNGFHENSREYYTRFIQELERNNAWWLYFAFLWEELLAAGIFVFFYDTAIYYYGASSSNPDHRRHMAPYLLQWNAIVEAHSRGCKIYDFLGIANPVNPKDTLVDVSRFKEKFWWQIKVLPEKVIIRIWWFALLFVLMKKLIVFLRFLFR